MVIRAEFSCCIKQAAQLTTVSSTYGSQSISLNMRTANLHVLQASLSV